jgi:hypothetical protein
MVAITHQKNKNKNKAPTFSLSVCVSENFIAFSLNLRVDRLQNNPSPWTDIHTKEIKTHVKTLPCLGISSNNTFKIV